MAASPEFPTIARAREAGLRVRLAPGWQFWNRSDLLSKEPDSAQKLAALWIDAKLLIRMSRSSEEDVGPRTFASLAREEGPATNGGRSQYIGRVIDQSPTDCTHCSMSPGQVLCPTCGGEGYQEIRDQDGTVRIPCAGCRALGSIECGACDGTGSSHRVDIVWLEDDWKTLRYVYPPSLSFALESRLRKYVESVEHWPASLAVPLKEQLVSGPYRSGPASVEEFRGYVIDGPIDQARAMVDRIRGAGRVLQANVNAYVLPLVFLRYPKARVVLHHQIDGQMGVLAERARAAPS